MDGRLDWRVGQFAWHPVFGELTLVKQRRSPVNPQKPSNLGPLASLNQTRGWLQHSLLQQHNQAYRQEDAIEDKDVR
jgi:hypothetical protein